MATTPADDERLTDLEIYSATKRSAVEYLRSLSATDLKMTCTSCPDWAIQDVLAHHIHALRTIVMGGSIPQAARDAITEPSAERRVAAIGERNDWTQSGVDERSDRQLGDLLQEWDLVEGAMTESQATLVVDLSVHYDDIRETLDRQARRQAPDIRRSLELFYRHHQRPRLRNAGQKSVRLQCTETGAMVGNEGDYNVRGETYDLLRVLTSRRTRPEAEPLLDWGRTPKGTIDWFPVYGWPDEPHGG